MERRKTGHYDFGDLPWDEFMKSKRKPPCNKKRLETKKSTNRKRLGKKLRLRMLNVKTTKFLKKFSKIFK